MGPGLRVGSLPDTSQPQGSVSQPQGESPRICLQRNHQLLSNWSGGAQQLTLCGSLSTTLESFFFPPRSGLCYGFGFKFVFAFKKNLYPERIPTFHSPVFRKANWFSSILQKWQALSVSAASISVNLGLGNGTCIHPPSMPQLNLSQGCLCVPGRMSLPCVSYPGTGARALRALCANGKNFAKASKPDNTSKMLTAKP